MLDQNKLNALAAVKSENVISIYIPTHRVDGIQEDRINYKNAINEAANQLQQKGLSEKEANQFVNEAATRLKDDKFWRQQSDALAVFIYDGKTEFYELPIETDTQVWVGNQLYLLPIIELMNDKKGFYLLALSLNEVKIYEGSEFTLAELEKNEVFPANLDEILRAYDPNQTVQHHNGGSNSIYHGQGGGKDIENARYEEYLRKVDKGIQQMVCDDDEKPLVVYTTPSLIGIYRQVNTYPHLMEDYVEGNPENEDMLLLHEKAWLTLEEKFITSEKAELAAFNQDLADDRAAFNLISIVPAAFAGQIATLYLAKGAESWGKYDPINHSVEIHAQRQEDSQPLLNDIALAVNKQGGTVHVIDRNDLPRPTANANAQLRYELYNV